MIVVFSCPFTVNFMETHFYQCSTMNHRVQQQSIFYIRNKPVRPLLFRQSVHSCNRLLICHILWEPDMNIKLCFCDSENIIGNWFTLFRLLAIIISLILIIKRINKCRIVIWLRLRAIIDGAFWIAEDTKDLWSIFFIERHLFAVTVEA